MDVELSSEIRAFIDAHRVGHLATADGEGSPHVIPVCYVYDGCHIYTPLDLKPKRVALLQLKRVRNVMVNPRVALAVDHYSEDWSRLAYVLVQGIADILPAGDEFSSADTMLREKYPQYSQRLEPRFSMLRIKPEKVVSWGRV